MEPLTVLGAHVITALLLPGFIVLTAAAVLFPELRTMLSGASAPEQVAAVFLSSFLSGHLPYLVERYVLTRFWGVIYRSYRLQARSSIMAERGAIITRCDTHGVSRTHFDSALASFILYYNSSFWCVIFAIAALFRHPKPQEMLAACVIGGISLIALFFTAPLYKRNMIGVLEVLKEELQHKFTEAPNRTLQGTPGSRSASISTPRARRP